MTDNPDWTAEILGAVTISGPVTVTGAVTVTGSVSIVGAVYVTGTVSISGDVNVTGTVSISGPVTITGNVTVTSGTINVQTAGGANIVIDKLVQGAYTESRTAATITLSNNGASNAAGGAAGYYEGKFFPRGSRGFIYTVDIYEAAIPADSTITVYLSPFPGFTYMAGPFTVTTTGPAAAGWRTVSIGIAWAYDSLFIIAAHSLNTKSGYDSGTPCDYYSIGTTLTAAPVPGAYRLWARANIAGQTVGDLPVSGTISAIILPQDTAKNGGLQTLSEWASINGTAAYFIVGFGNTGFGTGTNSNYTVPAGKKLVITSITANMHATVTANADLPQICRALVQNTTLGVIISDQGGNGGIALNLSAPHIAAAGQVINAQFTCYANHNCDGQIVIQAFLINA